jgi:hypothetical protein
VFREAPPDPPESFFPRRDLCEPAIARGDFDWGHLAAPGNRKLLALALIADVSGDLDAVAFAEKLAEYRIIHWPSEFSVTAPEIDAWVEELRKGNDEAVRLPYTPPPPGIPF